MLVALGWALAMVLALLVAGRIPLRAFPGDWALYLVLLIIVLVVMHSRWGASLP